MKSIVAPEAARPLGHYAQAIAHGGLLFLSTQLGIDPDDPEASPGTISVQTRRILENVDAILRAEELDKSAVVKVMIYLSDIAHWDDVNDVYAEWFKDHRPARGVIAVDALHMGYDVAFDVTAAYPPSGDPRGK